MTGQTCGEGERAAQGDFRALAWEGLTREGLEGVA